MAKKIDKSGIYIDAQNLFRLLYTAQFEMDKRDRPVIVTRMFDHTEAVISHFALAYREDDLEDKRRHVDKMQAHFEALKVEIRMAIDFGMFKKPATINGARELIVRISEGMDKWRNSMVLVNYPLGKSDAQAASSVPSI